jgi:hypothetical protein
VEKPSEGLWKSSGQLQVPEASAEKNKGAGSAPESRKYLEWNRLREDTYFLPFFAFLVLFLAAFFFAGMWTVTSSWQI